MSRWGRYGHYDGTCDGSFCRYNIELQSPLRRLANNRFGIYLGNDLLTTLLYPLILSVEYNGPMAELRTHFAVQDRVVQRKSASFWYVTPRTIAAAGEASLIAVVRADSHAGGTNEWGWEQLADHPYFVVTRPGGCTFCLMAKITFAMDTPTEEANRLLSFNLSCLTDVLPCKYLEDVYPPAEAWHMYDGAVGGRPGDPSWKWPGTESRGDCKVPLFARGREADSIISVTALSETTAKDQAEESDRALVRLDSTIKGKIGRSSGEMLDVGLVHDYESSKRRFEYPMTTGKSFLLIVPNPDLVTKKLDLDWCLIISDSPEARAELTRPGPMSMQMRVPDPEAKTFVPW